MEKRIRLLPPANRSWFYTIIFLFRDENDIDRQARLSYIGRGFWDVKNLNMPYSGTLNYITESHTLENLLQKNHIKIIVEKE
jgi:hypothetical protein